jgi:hypothetical protein
MYEKKHDHITKPDMSKLKAVVIDARTKIYVPFDVDPEVARARYWSHRDVKSKELATN